MASYEILNENSTLIYSVETLKFFKDKNHLTCKEIGDGNLNNVFRIVDSNSGKSLILKQSLPYARTSIEMKLDAKRGEIEAMGFMTQGKLSPSMVPIVYNYDPSKYIIAMEDLTEHLVLTNSAFLASRNRIDNHLLDFVKENVFDDKNVAFEVAKLKHNFMCNAQALLHGDAHIGSIFVKENSLKFIDTEFSFYGPMGFDVGMFLANLFMNACYHKALGNIQYKNYVLEQIESFIDNFKKEFIEVWDKYATEHFAKTNEEFKFWYLNSILKDTAGYCACEMIRRTTGSSHVKEMDDYNDKDIQKKAQMKNITLALQILFNQEKFKCGKDYRELF